MFAFTIPLALCLALASGRDYRLRAPPSITHSIVNLGKMELNVYLNSKPASQESPINEYEISHQPKPIQSIPSESGECPCQKNRLKNRNQDLYSSSDMLSKILMNNDLFKDPMSSSLCCSSHEQVQEEFYLEFNPKPIQPMSMRQELPPIQHLTPIVHNFPPLQAMPMDKPFKPMQYLPLLLDTLYKGPQKQKQKTVEIFLFPTKKPVAKTVATKRAPVTPEIRAVGDKKTTMVFDLLAANSSVKKDLNKEVGEQLKDMDAMITDKTTHTIQNYIV